MRISDTSSFMKPAERLAELYGLERESALQATSVAQTRTEPLLGSTERPQVGLTDSQIDRLSISPAASLRAQQLEKTDNGEEGQTDAGREDGVNRDGITGGYSKSLSGYKDTKESTDPVAEANQRIRKLQKEISQVNKDIQSAHAKLSEASAKAKAETRERGDASSGMEGAAGQAEEITPPSAGGANGLQESPQGETQAAQREISQGLGKLTQLLQELAQAMKQAQGGGQDSAAQQEAGNE